jgi:hypothetical protein
MTDSHPSSQRDTMTIGRVLSELWRERRYQKFRWGFRQEDGSFIENHHAVSSYIVFMQDYLTEAIHYASREEGFCNALDSLRKVVALGIRCFEEHGVPPRCFDDPIINARDHFEAY